MNNELKKTWKEAAVLHFKTWSPGIFGIEENHEQSVRMPHIRVELQT
jgi:hypothetical protein